MRTLSLSDLQTMVKGSSWFGTGGGFPYSEQLRRLARFSSQAKFLLACPEDLDPQEIVCCAYGLGSAANTGVDLSVAFRHAIDGLERLTGARCSAIFPAETTIESAIFEVSSTIGLAVLDADTCGGRAVPELRFDNFTLFGHSIAPLVACDCTGRTLEIQQYSSIDEVELKLRDFAQSSVGGAIAVVDHAISVATAAATLTLGTLSRSLALGRHIENVLAGDSTVERLLLDTGFEKVLSSATVLKSALCDADGFYAGSVKLGIESGEQATLLYKNECLSLEFSGRGRDVSAPDLITLIDPHSLIGLHSTEIKNGISVDVLTQSASNLWNSERARALFADTLKLSRAHVDGM